jgi:hypothetical protein
MLKAERSERCKRQPLKFECVCVCVYLCVYIYKYIYICSKRIINDALIIQKQHSRPRNPYRDNQPTKPPHIVF